MTEQEAKEILSLSPEEKVELPNLSEVYEIARRKGNRSFEKGMG